MLIIAENILFLSLILYKILIGYLTAFAELVDKIRDKINDKYPNLKNHPSFSPFLVNKTQSIKKARKEWKLLSYSVTKEL